MPATPRRIVDKAINIPPEKQRFEEPNKQDNKTIPKRKKYFLLKERKEARGVESDIKI